MLAHQRLRKSRGLLILDHERRDHVGRMKSRLRSASRNVYGDLLNEKGAYRGPTGATGPQGRVSTRKTLGGLFVQMNGKLSTIESERCRDVRERLRDLVALRRVRYRRGQ